jgi:hypothetical protein
MCREKGSVSFLIWVQCNMASNVSAQNGPLFSDERFRKALRRHIDIAINIDHTFTRQQLADESRVNIHTIDGILSLDPAKRRRVAMEDGMSIAWVLGEDTVNALMMVMRYGGATPLDSVPRADLTQIVPNGLADFAVIAAALGDGRIDHTEEVGTTAAADRLIASILPLSSAGKSA